MKDPVNNFEIPVEWIKRATLPEDELRAGIASGRLVLLADGSVLRRGYTTGTTATAAAKAAVLSLKRTINHVSVLTPAGIEVTLPVSASGGRASAIKDCGDHGFDITGGIEIVAEAHESDNADNSDDGLSITAGKGIGVKRGVPAINPAPMKQIRTAIAEAVREIGISGANVLISVPKGEEIARETLNSRVGVIGGISILGTTGFVEPWNEHLLETKHELIQQADRVVLTTGRLGMRYSNMLFPDHTIVMIGNRIPEGLDAAKDKSEVIVCGLPGLILKWLDPDILRGSGSLTTQELIDRNPADTRIDRTLSAAKEDAPGVRIVLINRDGSILRDYEP
uniref:Cobalt-precorrin-5B C(1)-methyltransferase n=1 Tax=Candidatus Methanogaster sp. ANME-2c ERB4 TaxID=2759911 RepID=A0A7G9YG11_9EURY|nr:cobalt-precorrin-5B C(1)-methyltransferase [Methanosarcinales archaeon ANME-2c ERB4]